ncbi:MAG: hypothetical protein J07HN4v3_00515 [Halonotius sp. J07HN4]|nr:MAG: hypothetical protein J07HN4v3_00515 [Halonotius sp. J07HN4]
MRRRQLMATLACGLPVVLAGCQTDSSTDDDVANETNDSSEFAAAKQSTIEDLDPEWPTGPYASYETTPVVVRGDDGELRGAVLAAVADTGSKKRLGLSAAESMPADGGMLFPYDEVREHTYIMPNMSFGLDIIFADADGVITEIHNAPEPGPDESGANQQYTGRGQYVFEVNYKWTATNNVSVGDRLIFER